MPGARRVRDNALLDALEAAESQAYHGAAWRVSRAGRDPLQCSSAGGRWDDRSFDVLYTALERDGAIAELHYHLSRGQPVIPSRVDYRLYELGVALPRVLTLPTLGHLEALGYDIGRFGQLSYDDLHTEYPRTQDIAEAAHFLDYGGLLVPSARWDGRNLVVFCDQVAPDAMEVARDHGAVDWLAWSRRKVGRPQS